MTNQQSSDATQFIREWLERRVTETGTVSWQTEQFLAHRERLRRDLVELLDLDRLDEEAEVRDDLNDMLELLASTIREKRD